MKECKEEYQDELKDLEGKKKYDNKRKRHVSVTPTWGPLAKSVRLFYADLKDAKNSDQHFQNAIKLAERCYNSLAELDDCSKPPAKIFRASGGGRKSQAPEVRDALFQWFIDVRGSLKGRLSRKMFKLKDPKDPPQVYCVRLVIFPRH